MNALAVVLVAATFAVDYGWTARDEGGVEYIIQIEPHLAQAMRDGDLPEGVASEIVPQVQNVRAFRIVIGDDDLPRDELPPAESSAAATRNEAAKAEVPLSSMLAADTRPELGSRYGQEPNPRYADPVAGPTPTKSVLQNTAESMRNSANQAAGDATNRASSQVQAEADRLQQGLENRVQNGMQNIGNALRGTIEPSSTQPRLNQTDLNNQNNAAQNSANPQNGANNGANSGQIDTQWYGTPRTLAQQQYDQSQQQQSAQSNPPQWPPQANHFQNNGQQPASSTAQQVPANQGNYANGQAAQWPPARSQANWQAGNPVNNVPNPPQQQQYQPPVQQQQQHWAQQHQQQATPQYQAPYQNQTPTNPAPPLHNPNNNYGNNPYLASNPPLTGPSNGGGMQPPPVTGNNAPTTPVSNNTPEHNHDHAAEKPNRDNSKPPQTGGASLPANNSNPPPNQPQNPPRAPSDSKADPDTVAWVAMWLLFFSISGNLFLGYIASNFQKQTRKMAMQLRRARAH